MKSSLSDQKNGVTCTEDMGLAGKFTIAYTVIGSKQQAVLVEEKHLTALKPITRFARHGPGLIPKTKNLLQVMESLGSGKDVLSALADLNSTNANGEANLSVGKPKTY
jgi:hypothetical protein